MFEPKPIVACKFCGLPHALRIPCSVAIEMGKAALLKPPVESANHAEVLPPVPPAERTYRKKSTMSATARKKLSDKAKAFWAKKRAGKSSAD